MNQITTSRMIFKTADDPFPCYEPWPLPDGCLEVVDVGYWLATLPRGSSPQGEDDGLIAFMQEAWRCLKPGGSLAVSVPAADHSYALANPLFRRYFNRDQFTAFGRPADAEEEEWRWDRYGVDFGTRFVIVLATQTGKDIEVTMEKPDEEFKAQVECFTTYTREQTPAVEGEGKDEE